MRPLLLGRFSALALTVSLAGACGGGVQVDGSSSATGSGGASGNATAGSGTTGSGATGSGTGSGGDQTHGDCMSDADCKAMAGGTCIALTQNGYLACSYPPMVAMGCTTGMDDQCCRSAECSPGMQCYVGGPLPQFCGIASGANECGADGCQTDADCPAAGGKPRFCAPAGVYDRQVRACADALCKTNADCTGGAYCGAYFDPCCNAFAGLYCISPSGCQKSKDCKNAACVVNPQNLPECTTMFPSCPG